MASLSICFLLCFIQNFNANSLLLKNFIKIKILSFPNLDCSLDFDYKSILNFINELHEISNSLVILLFFFWIVFLISKLYINLIPKKYSLTTLFDIKSIRSLYLDCLFFRKDRFSIGPLTLIWSFIVHIEGAPPLIIASSKSDILKFF